MSHVMSLSPSALEGAATGRVTLVHESILRKGHCTDKVSLAVKWFPLLEGRGEALKCGWGNQRHVCAKTFLASITIC